MHIKKRPFILFLLVILTTPVTLFAHSTCGDQGVWLQVLGSGGPEIIQDARASSSYLVWLNGKARLLVDAGGGSALNFGKSGADFKDLDAIVFSRFAGTGEGFLFWKTHPGSPPVWPERE